MINMKSEKSTTETVNIDLTKQDIADLLSKSSGKIKKMIANAEKIEIVFNVPTGGDYSGMSLDIDEKSPVKVTIVSLVKSKSDKEETTEKE